RRRWRARAAGLPGRHRRRRATCRPRWSTRASRPTPRRPTSRDRATPKANHRPRRAKPPRSNFMRPVAVAITGSIGAGKTEALQAFARHGAATISSDDIVHELLRDDPEVRGELLERFGTGILDDAGNVDRAAISSFVFDDLEALAWLE